MKTILTIILIAISGTFSHAQEVKKGQTITVTINNITNNKGNGLLSLHTEETFMKGQGIQSIKTKIVDGKIVTTFKNVEPGTYAIIALHDENENNTMDFDSFGMPMESYGTSGNTLEFGPPQFNTSKFNVNQEDLEMTIVF